MLTILGSVLGFATSTVPTIMDFFKEKEEKKAKAEEFKLPIILVPCEIDVDLKPLNNKNIKYHNMSYTYDSLHALIDQLINIK